MIGSTIDSRWRQLLKPAVRPVMIYFFNLFGSLSSLPSPVPILLYHSLDESGSDLSVSPGEFRQQMDWLKSRRYRVYTLAEYADALTGVGLKTPAVVITFDDGYANFLTEAQPILNRYGFRATIFVQTGYLGRTSGGFSLLDLPLLGRGDLAALAAQGYEIASHTVTHPCLTRLERSRARAEIVDSRRILEGIIGRPVVSFAYPRGAYNREIVELVRAAGYLSAVTLRPGNRGRPEDIFTLPRITLRPRDGRAYFRLVLGPFFERYHALFQLPIPVEAVRQ